MQGDVFILGISILCTMANKRYTNALRISILLLKQFFFYKALTTDYLDIYRELNNHLLVTFKDRIPFLATCIHPSYPTYIK